MSISDFSRYRLMTPVPVPLPQLALEQMGQPMIHHRTPEFTQILERVLKKLKEAFLTKQPVMMHVSTGSGGMESALVNTLSPGDEVLCVVSGKFGERWRDIAMAYHMKTHTIEVPWGEAVDPFQVRSALEARPQIRAVLCQASETSTAVLHPIQEIAEIVKAHQNTLFMVDAITAIGSTPLPMDEWGIDVVVAGSQKAFMLPTGLAFVALSEKAWRFQKTSTCPRYYFDLAAEKEANSSGQTHFSSAVSHIRALDVALDFFSDEGLKRSIKRSQLMADVFRAGVKALGLALYSKAPTPAVTAVLLPEEIDGKKLRKHIEEKYNITVMGGQGMLTGKILRVGHLGNISDDDVVATIEALGLSLIDLGLATPTAEGLNEAVKGAQTALLKGEI